MSLLHELRQDQLQAVGSLFPIFGASHKKARPPQRSKTGQRNQTHAERALLFVTKFISTCVRLPFVQFYRLVQKIAHPIPQCKRKMQNIFAAPKKTLNIPNSIVSYQSENNQ
jgi:hypothetical protein